jgi:5'-AMP-activated protein kinase regulatory beta subunit
MRTSKERKARKVTFSFLAPEARKAELAGDFSDWDPTKHPMKKAKKGVWTTSLNLAPGTYQYKFFVDGAWYNDPSCTDCVENPFGTLNCVKKVE